jgi:hypothetical protein
LETEALPAAEAEALGVSRVVTLESVLMGVPHRSKQKVNKMFVARRQPAGPV